MIDLVDPFIGTAPADMPSPEGLASTWWWPKPPIGNTHPGATHPFGMVSACSFSGAYPTGYGIYDRSTEGVPAALFDHLQASGFTHFQQSGTGAIRKYYNYLRVSPMMSPLDDLGDSWPITDEVAEPGYYAATLGNGVRCEITVGPKSAVHRYTFPEHRDARIVIDASHGGLTIDRGGTVPLRASLDSISSGVAAGHVVMEGVPVCFHVECDTPDWRQMLWYDRRLMAGGSTLRFDSIRPTTLRPFGLLWAGPVHDGDVVELRIGFSLRSTEQARDNLRRNVAVSSLAGDAIASLASPSAHAFDRRRSATRSSWAEHLGAIRVDSASPDRQQVFATALYHSLIKPCFAPDESPFWPIDGPFVFDLCTMWDIYRTQLPLMTTLFPDRAVELANALLHIAEEEGNLPIGYRMAKGADRFSRQGSALSHTFLADVCALGLPGVDWDWALCHMDADLRRQYGEEFIEHGVAHPITHTLDLAFGYHCTALVARHLGDDTLAEQFEGLASQWVNAYDPATGLIRDSSFYEGGKWNYSFRLGHDMAGRIELTGGDDAYVELLDRFFGFGADPVKQLGQAPSASEIAAGYELDRFEGLNNEPDMEAPWSYHWVGRPDRTAEIVHAIVMNQFGIGAGGLPGNDDSGGISSWYVWASIGLFPVAGQQIVLINAPSFSRSRLRLSDHTLVIDTVGFVEPTPGGPAQYVQAVTVDDRPLDRSWMPMTDLVRSSRIIVELGSQPSTWAMASRARPPSTSELPHLNRPPAHPEREPTS